MNIWAAGASPIDILLTDQLVARMRPVGPAERYEIQLALLVDGELFLSGEPYLDSLEPALARSIRMLGPDLR